MAVDGAGAEIMVKVGAAAGAENKYYSYSLFTANAAYLQLFFYRRLVMYSPSQQSHGYI